MNQTVTPQHPAVVLRSQYVHVRALLAVACITITAMSIAVVVLATTHSARTTKATPSSTAAGLSAPAQTADTGARLDHRGLHYRATRASTDQRHRTPLRP